MIINKKDAEAMCGLFLSMIADTYGPNYHHIGDGDSINETDANNIRYFVGKYINTFLEDYSIEIEGENK